MGHAVPRGYPEGPTARDAVNQLTAASAVNSANSSRAVAGRWCGQVHHHLAAAWRRRRRTSAAPVLTPRTPPPAPRFDDRSWRPVPVRCGQAMPIPAWLITRPTAQAATTPDPAGCPPEPAPPVPGLPPSASGAHATTRAGGAAVVDRGVDPPTGPPDQRQCLEESGGSRLQTTDALAEQGAHVDHGGGHQERPASGRSTLAVPAKALGGALRDRGPAVDEETRHQRDGGEQHHDRQRRIVRNGGDGSGSAAVPRIT